MTLTAADVRNDFKYFYPDELPFFKSLVKQLAPWPRVLNIGAGAGTSGLAILETRDDVTLITVDITDASSPYGCLEAERDVITRAGFGHEFGHRWFQVHGSSQELSYKWSSAYTYYMDKTVIPFFDLVFVDGDHSYAGCVADITGWMPWIYHNGIIAVHDYNKQMLTPDPNGPHPKEWGGVNAAVDDLLIPNFELLGQVDSLIAFWVKSPNERK